MRPGTIQARHAAHLPGSPWVTVLICAVTATAGFALTWALTLAFQIGTTVQSDDVGDLVTAVPEVSAAPQDGDPVRILLIGSDDRTGANRDIGGGDAAGMRSDATVLVQLAGDRSRIDMVSIPRDLQVDIPTCTLLDGTEVPGGHGSFNVAFSNGARQGNAAEAAACTINTVHQLTGVPIDHWVVVDFQGFIAMVDALGGIPIDVPERVVSVDANLELEAGHQLLSGTQALGYARLRTAEVGDVSGSDLQRITRQQQLLKATMETALSKNLLTDVDELTRFIRAGAGSITTDHELARVNIAVSIAGKFAGVSTDNLVATTVPWQYTENRLRVVLTEDAPAYFSDLQHDRPISVTVKQDATSEWG